MKKNRAGNHSTEIFWQKYISLLLAVFVFALGMSGLKTVDAAVTSETVTRTVTIKPRLSSNETKIAQMKMHVMLENLDLNAYAKYTAELRKMPNTGMSYSRKPRPEAR